MGGVDLWMPLWIADYQADTQDLTCEEHGAYLLLLMALWRRGGRLPLDHERLAHVARLPGDRWPSIWATLERFFKLDGGLLEQRRLTTELHEAREHRKAASDHARAAAEARWERARQRKAAASAAQDARAQPGQNTGTAGAVLEECPPPSPSPSPGRDPDKRPRKRRRGVDVGEVMVGFDQFFDAYPRKRAPADAEKAWRQTAMMRPPLPQLLDAVGRLRAEGRPIDKYPYPAKWLRDHSWRDEVPRSPTTNGSAVPAGVFEDEDVDRYR